jgi:hypothetical protein
LKLQSWEEYLGLRGRIWEQNGEKCLGRICRMYKGDKKCTENFVKTWRESVM